MRMSLTALLVAFLTTAVGAAEPAEPTELSPRHTRVAMFKNGLALVETQVELAPADGEQTYRVAPLPPARFGSLWMAWPDDVAISEVRSVRVEGETRAPVLNMSDLLRASVGRSVAVWVQNEWIAGELLSVAEADPTPPVWPDLNQPWRSATPQPLPGAGAGAANLVMLQQDDQVLALPLNMIGRVRLDTPLENATVAQPEWRDALTFTVKPAADEAADDAPHTLTMHYLVQGLAWSPSYVVELADEKTARLSAKAVIMNDFADLTGTKAELVAGFPHLPAAGMPSAMTLQPMQAMLQQMRQMVGYDQVGGLRNTAVGYMRQEARYASEPASPVASMPVTPVAGEASEDLFFFQVDDLTLAQHERLYHPLFAADVPYTHCYTWDIPDYIDEQRGYQDQPAMQEQVVWHALRLTNTTGQPWTTAPGTTMKAGRVLGQDTLHYTPPGAQTDLRITQAVSLKAEQSEQEVTRERQAERFFGYHYDKVTVEGELQLTSYREEPVTVQVTKTLTGEVAEATGEATIVKLARGLRRVNPTSKLTWNVDVEPGADGVAKLTYRYTVYVRN